MQIEFIAYKEIEACSVEVQNCFIEHTPSMDLIRKKIDKFRQARSNLLGVKKPKHMDPESTLIPVFNAALHKQKQAEQLIHKYFEMLVPTLNSSVNSFIEKNSITKFETIYDILKLLPNEQQHLFIDINLPLTWDFTRDLFVVSSDFVNLINLIETRGQERSIVLTNEKDLKDCEDNYIYIKNKDDIFRSLIEFGYTPPRQIFTISKTETSQDEIRKTLTKAVDSLNVYATTSNNFSKTWVKNEIKNSKIIASSSCVTSLRKKFSKKDIMIISPGPSLKYCLTDIQRLKSSYILIAPLQTLPALFEKGIEPDFYVCIDPADFTEHLKMDQISTRSGLIIAESCHPNVYRLCNSKKFIIFTTKQVLDIHKLLEGKLLNLFGSSVSVIATDLARELGAKSITLVGQDLIIDDNSTYIGLPKNYNVTKLDGQKLFWQGKRVELKYLQAYDGKFYPTRPDFHNFHFEFEIFANEVSGQVKLYNATYHGAVIKGFKKIELSKKLSTSETKTHLDTEPSKFDGNHHLISDQFFLLLQEKIKALSEIKSIAGKVLSLIESKPENYLFEINVLESDLKSKIQGELILSLYIKPFLLIFSSLIASARTLDSNLTLSENLYATILTTVNSLLQELEGTCDEHYKI